MLGRCHTQVSCVGLPHAYMRIDIDTHKDAGASAFTHPRLPRAQQEF